MKIILVSLLNDRCDTIETFDEIPAKDQKIYIKQCGTTFDWQGSRGMVGVH